MASMPNQFSQVHLTSTMSRVVVGGIDTHKDLHVVAVIDTAKRCWARTVSPPPAPATGPW